MTDHPAALVSVPLEPTEAMLGAAFEAMMRAEADGIDQAPREVWSAMLAAAPAAPQAAGVGRREEIVEAVKVAMNDAWCDITSDTDCWPADLKRVSKRGPMRLEYRPAIWTDTTAEMAANAILALRAPSREPEGGAVRQALSEAVALLDKMIIHVGHGRADYDQVGIFSRSIATGRMKQKTSLNLGDVRQAVMAGKAALATREEAPAEAGERDYPAEFEAWWATYRHRNRDVADYPIKKQIAFDAFYHAALGAPPQAREDAQPVAWAPAEDIDLLTRSTRDGRTARRTVSLFNHRRDGFSPLYTHPAPDALLGPLEDLVSWFTKPVQGLNGTVWVIPAGDQGADDAVSAALAALQAEQGAK